MDTCTLMTSFCVHILLCEYGHNVCLCVCMYINETTFCVHILCAFQFCDYGHNVSVCLQGGSEVLQCPRCQAAVSAHPGVCSTCGENVYQCHKCRWELHHHMQERRLENCGILSNFLSIHTELSIMMRRTHTCATRVGSPSMPSLSSPQRPRPVPRSIPLRMKTTERR